MVMVVVGVLFGEWKFFTLKLSCVGVLNRYGMVQLCACEAYLSPPPIYYCD